MGFSDFMQNMSPRVKGLFLAGYFIAMLITLSILTGGVSDQLEFSSGSICLLFVENYHLDTTANAWVFDSFSPSCGAEVTAGAIGFIILFGTVLTHAYFLRKSEEPSRNVILSLAIITSVWAFIAFVMACIFSAGLGQTCSQFTASGKSCSAVFGQGFFANDVTTVYTKNINTINAALGAAWVTFLGFLAFSVSEWYSYRNSSLKWW